MKQDVNVELFHSGVWNDITDATYARDTIQITRGRGDEWNTAAPSNVSLTADNRDGTYNPRNPVSPLYGLVGRNTPGRIHLGTPHPAAASSSLVASTSHVAPSVDAPTASGILICAWSGPFPSGSYTAPASMTESLDQNDAVQTLMAARQVISGAGATGTRTATSSTSETWLAVSVLVHGPTALTTGAVGGTTSITVDGNQGDWWIVISSFGWDDSSVSPPDFPWDSDGGGWILLADTGTVNSADSDAAFNRMKAWGKQIHTTNSAHDIGLAADDIDSTISWLTRIPAAQIDSVWTIRANGEAASWTPRRAIKGDAWTNLAVAGPTRRLGQGRDPLKSALRRFVDDQSPAAYWAFDAGSGSTFADLTAGNGTAFTRYATSGPGTFEPGTGELAPWSGTGALLRGDVLVAAQTNVSSTTQITLDVLLKGDGFTGGVMSIILDGPTGDGSDTWQIDMYSDLEEIDIFEPGSGLNADTYPGLFDGNAQRHLRFNIAQDGADVDYTLYVDGEAIVTDTVATLTLPRVIRVSVMGSESGVAVGDLVLWADTPPSVADVYAASTGHSGEPAGSRFLRLCAEEGITAAVVGDPDDTVPMGPQFPDTMLNQFREIEATDDGYVYDAREFRGVTFRTGRSRYNQDAALELDHDAFEVAPPTDPVLDDQATRNDVTASRRSGGSARAVRESGPLNVSAPEDDAEGVGRYTAQVDVNPFSDLVLPDYAGWHLHRGTVDETRWPTVTIDLDASPDLAGTVSAIDVGDRIVVDNLPDDLSPDPVSLLVVGTAETIGTHRRLVAFTCIPESQFHIAELEHDDYSFLGSDGSTVNTAFSAGTDTSLSVAVADGYPLWDDADGPFDILVSGVRLTVTAIAGASSPQTFTVTQTPVNGVVKTLAVGDRVDLFHKTYIGL